MVLLIFEHILLEKKVFHFVFSSNSHNFFLLNNFHFIAQFVQGVAKSHGNKTYADERNKKYFNKFSNDFQKVRCFCGVFREFPV